MPRPALAKPATESSLPAAGSPIPTELVLVSSLKPHPRNYRVHPPDQLAHIIASIEQHGIYRNVVVAQDSTILAGHGVVQALTQMRRSEVPVIRLPIEPDSTAALKVLAGDNEISHLAEVDDATFTALLLEIKDMGGLLGTGYDDAMLANLMFVTRGEMADQNEAQAWADAGMPGDLNGACPFKIIVSFLNANDREQFVALASLHIMKRESVVWSARWPHREAEDHSSLRFTPAKEKPCESAP